MNKSSFFSKKIIFFKYRHQYIYLRGRRFMTSTKNDQFFDSPPHPHHPQKWTIDLWIKQKNLHASDKFQDPLATLFSWDVINIWSLLQNFRRFQICNYFLLKINISEAINIFVKLGIKIFFRKMFKTFFLLSFPSSSLKTPNCSAFLSPKAMV